MALSLGIGLVLGCSYEMLEDIKLIPFEPEIPFKHLIILMSLTYVVGTVLGCIGNTNEKSFEGATRRTRLDSG